MSLKNSQELKQLQSRKIKLEAEAQTLLEESKDYQRKYSKVCSQVYDIEKQIDGLKEKYIIITEHAILRYLERVEGFDMEKVKASILPNDVKTQIKAFNGNGKYPIGSGFQIVVKDGSIVSVV